MCGHSQTRCNELCNLTANTSLVCRSTWIYNAILRKVNQRGAGALCRSTGYWDGVSIFDIYNELDDVI